jgi:hypothetical protein
MMPMTKRRRKNPDDVGPEAWELILYAETRAEMMPMRDSIIKNVIRKINRGTYDPKKAGRLWQYWMDDAAQRYTREFDVPGHHASSYGIFTATIRREAADWIAPKFYDEIMLDNYDHLLKLKRKNPLGSKHKVITKKRRSAAQIRATKKMIAAARARRTKKKVRRRNPTIRGTYQTARADPRQVRKRTPVRTGRRINPVNHYGIKSGGRWFNGRGWTTTKNNAAMWKTLTTARDVAQTLSDHTNKAVTVHTM